MSENLLILAENDYPLWNEFVRSSPQGSFFYETEWANIISYTFSRSYKIIVKTHNDQIEAGCLVFYQEKLAQKLITPQPFFPYNGPVLTISEETKYQKTIAHNLQTVTAFIKYLNKNFDLWMIRTSPHLKDMRPFLWHNCRVEPTYTYQLSLSSWPEVENNYSQSVRKKIRHAGEQNLTIVESTDRQRFIEMYITSYERHDRTPLVKEKDLDKFLNMALKLPRVKMYYTRQGDQTIAGRVIVEDQQVVFDLLAGSDDPTGLGSTFLVHSILEKYSGESSLFDFMGADHPQIEEFKRGFGGRLVTSYRVTGPVKFPLSFIHALRTRQLLRGRGL